MFIPLQGHGCEYSRSHSNSALHAGAYDSSHTNIIFCFTPPIKPLSKKAIFNMPTALAGKILSSWIIFEI
jgi:hypothetical protein